MSRRPRGDIEVGIRFTRFATWTALAAFTASAAFAASAEAPFSFDAAPGRLPKDVVPLAYSITVVPNPADMTFTGSESVQLRFRAATATVQFNSKNEMLAAVRLDGRPVQAVATNDEQQLTTVSLTAPAPIGLHTLTFTYRGTIEKQPRGLFIQPYDTAAGSTGSMLSTQMEATDARRMFPCWDEPAFRATFQLTAVLPAAWAAVSNMPIEKRVVRGTLATVTFARSPRMPSYLVALSAGDLREVTAQSGGVKFGVWAVRGRERDGSVALANARQILADYNAYFAFPYPLPKLDSIAVPGGFTGAMENWGAITYNDHLLLLSASSTIADRQEVYSVQAHEMAHQWYGDLVTMGWWDDIWLNESFASWLAAKETDLRNPEWKWWEKQDSAKEVAMAADARASSHAIQQHVSDELQVANAFDPEITYSKGQAVLRMFESYLGADGFRDGVRRYVKARAFSNATTADLWNALSAANGRNIGAIAADWTEQPGFPLVSVNARCDAGGARTIALSQTRFLLHGNSPLATHWQIPLRIRSGTTDQPQTGLLSADGQSLPAGRCGDALSINADAIGFYRTEYDAATMDANSKHFASLADGDRIALLDDQWALVESGRESLASYLTLTGAMGGNLDTRAWEQIVSALGTIEYAERGTPGYAAFTTYARSVIKPIADRLGWNATAEDSPDTRELRRTLLRDLGEWGDQATIDAARRRFDAFLLDRRTLGPDDQTVVFSIVARHADTATFDRLHALARTAKDEADLERDYTALMSVRDPQLAQQAAQIALSGEIPPQAVSIRIRLLAALGRQHGHLSWTTFTNNVDSLLSATPEFAPLIIAQYIPGFYWDSVPLDQLEAWVRAHVPAQMSANVERGMETARFKFAEKQALVPAADAYVAAAVRRADSAAMQ